MPGSNISGQTMTVSEDQGIAPAAPIRSGALRTRSVRAAEALFYFVALMIVWEGGVHLFGIPTYLIPAPSKVALALYDGFTTGTYAQSLGVTLFEIVVGFFLGAAIGLLLGVAMVTIGFLERVFYPYVVALQTVPKVAVAPLMIIWFGFGLESKVIIV